MLLSHCSQHFYLHMDDKEYYSMKRITSLSVEQLQKSLKKITNHNPSPKIDNSNYRQNAIHQGHDDAEMLLEKQNDFDNNTNTL